MTTPVATWADLGKVIFRGLTPCIITALAVQFIPTEAVRFLLLMILGLLAGSWIHESGHVLAYWHVRRSTDEVGVRHFFALAFSVTVPYPDIRPRLVAFAGPFIPGVLGCLLCLLGILLPSSECWAVGIAFSIHLLGLLPGNSDGNRIWRLDT